MFLAKHLFFAHNDVSDRSIVLNAISGACDIMPTTLARDLELRRGRSLPDGLLQRLGNSLEALQARGYLLESPAEEDIRLRELRDKTRKASPPLTKFVICPTYTCNLACTYCYEGDLTRHKTFMSIDQLRLALAAIDVLKRKAGVSRYLYELFGGEPLLPKSYPLISTLLTELDKRGETIAIVTNGTHIDRYIPLFRQRHDTIESLQITVDGPKSVHDQRRIYRNGSGSFDKIVAGVDRLLEEGFFVRIRVNVDRQNLNLIPELVDFMERREWTTYRHFACDIAPVTYHTKHVAYDHVMPESEIVRTIVEHIPDLLNPKSQCTLGMFRVLNHATSILEARRHGAHVLPCFTYCEATEGSIMVFGADGAIYACPDAIINREWAIGEYAPRFWLDETKAARWRRDIFSVPECNECEIATFCGGGCALVPLDRGSDRPACDSARETLHTYLTWWLDRTAAQASAHEKSLERTQ